MDGSGRRAPWMYRLLLWLLPRGFRERHGRAMEDMFVSAHAEAMRSGRMRAARLYAGESVRAMSADSPAIAGGRCAESA